MLIFEDVAYRELSFDGELAALAVVARPRRRAPGRDVLQGLLPGLPAGLGGRSRPSSSTLLADGKQNTDQCAGALGQRMVEEYGRAGHFEHRRPARRGRCTPSHWAALSAALDAHMPAGCTWSEPTGGMFTWVDAARRASTRAALRPAATEAGVAYVPGRPFYVSDDGANEMRLSFSHLDEGQLELAGQRLRV